MHTDRDIDVRVPRPDEYRAAADAFRMALLHGPVNDEDFEKSLPSWEQCDSLAAWDGDLCVAHVGAFRFDTVVPGGNWLATAGVTRVGVMPTHTRRGLLTQMMRRLLVESRDRGQVLASLRASEAVIYGRFGFGLAGEAAELELDPLRAVVVRGAAPGRMRLLRADEVLPTFIECYERVAALHAGAIRRPEWMWQRYLEEPINSKGSRSVVVHESPAGEVDGVVDYETSWLDDFGKMARGALEVHDLWGSTPSVELALWRHVLSIDLIRRVRATERPIDDPIRFAVRDYRGVHVGLRWDEQWLRLLDVDAALRARTYGAGQAVTIAVTDPLFADNNGTWQVSADGATRTSCAADAADLSVDIATLSALYLGGPSWHELAAAGAVEERTSGALGRAEASFATHPSPFCGSFF